MSHYSTRLKLEFDPFDPQAAARGYFAGAGRGELLDELLELSLAGGALLCVSGEKGSGKSTLAAEFCLRAGDDAECASIQASLFMNRARFQDALTAELPWLDAGADWLQNLERLARRAADLDLEARAIVLVIDEAHELSGEVVTALLEIARRCEGGLSLLLLGEPQLVTMLAQSLPANLVSRLTTLELAPFSGEDSFDYVRFKLATAGYTHKLPVSGELLASLHSSAAGIPGKLNSLVAEALAQTAAPPRPGPRSAPAKSLIEQAQSYWYAAAGLLAVLVVVLLWGSPGDPADRQASGSQSISVPVSTTRASADDAETNGPVTNLTGARTAAIERASPVTDGAGQNSAPQPDATPPGDGAVAAAEPEPGPATQSPAEPATSAAEPESQPAALAATDLQAPVASGEPLPAFTRALLEAPPQGFTIQVMGSRSRDNAQRFLSRNFAADSAGIVETRFQGQPWFVVVHGNFDSRDQARQAIASLPAVVRELQPFVRSLAEVQADAQQQLSSR